MSLAFERDGGVTGFSLLERERPIRVSMTARAPSASRSPPPADVPTTAEACRLDILGSIGGIVVFSAQVWNSELPRGRLLLGRLEVGVAPGGVIGDVNDVVDLGHRLGDRHLYPLIEGDRGHAAPLTSAAQA